jgi:hypothetical protein
MGRATPPQETPPTLESFQSVTGTPFMRAALTFCDRYAWKSFGRSGSDGADSIRNYLFLNSETLAGRWLFSDNRQLILDSDELSEPLQDKEVSTPTSRTVAFFYRVIDTDTNGDGQLTPADNLSLAYSRPDGQDYTVVLKGVGRVLGSRMTDNGKTHVVVYELDKKWYAVAISLRTFEVEKRGELPPR